MTAEGPRGENSFVFRVGESKNEVREIDRLLTEEVDKLIDRSDPFRQCRIGRRFAKRLCIIVGVLGVLFGLLLLFAFFY